MWWRWRCTPGLIKMRRSATIVTWMRGAARGRRVIKHRRSTIAATTDRAHMPSTDLAIWQLVELGLHVLALHLFKSPEFCPFLNVCFKLRRICKLHGPDVCGQLVLPPHDLTIIWRLDHAIARHGHSSYHTSDFLHQGLASRIRLLFLLFLFLPPLDDPLGWCSMLGTQVLGHALRSSDGVALQPLYRCICRFIVDIPDDHGAGNWCHPLFLPIATRTKRDLCERQIFQAHDRVGVQAQLPV
mmetsp:Transcript_14794/g.27397  ORF Transcript_14794/g.27397 Transcript_14794/m.27397 type:complete len:242 (+) Transcript_14794:479-1204(+)